MSGCSHSDFNFGCSGVNLITGVSNGEFVERQVPITFSFNAERINKIEFYGLPKYKVTVNNYFYNVSEVYFFNKSLSGTKVFDDTTVWFDFNTETKVLLFGSKSFVQYGKLRYQTTDYFSGKCS